MTEQQYTRQDYESAIQSLSEQLENAEQGNRGLHKTATANSPYKEIEQNLIQWQLDLSTELALISHQLRGHVIKRDKKGNEYWGEPTKTLYARVDVSEDGTEYIIDSKTNRLLHLKVDGEFREIPTDELNNSIIIQQPQGKTIFKIVEVVDQDRKLLNEAGAQEIEKIIRNYLNRNTLLSNYSEEMIMQRVEQFGNRLRRFIYLSYEQFGLTTDYKQRHFEMLVMNITDMIESSYYRALNGGERESLRTARQVLQNESVGQPKQLPMNSHKTGGSKIFPWNWR